MKYRKDLTPPLKSTDAKRLRVKGLFMGGVDKDKDKQI